MAYCGPRALPLSTFLAWPESDQRAALDWQAYEARRCKNCGIHPDDIADGAFHAHLEQCKGCQARERMTDTREARDGQRGVYAVVLPVAAPHCPRCARR
jgi:hypothetical protein